MDGFPSGQRGQTVNLLSVTSVVRIHPHPFNDPYYGLFYILSAMIGALDVAGWSSLEARRAHNPKVVGSNPTPAILPGLISNPGIFYENRDNQNVPCMIPETMKVLLNLQTVANRIKLIYGTTPTMIFSVFPYG